LATLLTILALFSSSPFQARVAPKAGGKSDSGTGQTCTVDAPSGYREEARKLWCGNGRVAKVSLRTDSRNYIAQVYLSSVGESAWRVSAAEAVARFRQIVNDVAERVPMNVAVTVRNAEGKRLALCSRDLIARTATCVIP